MTQSAHNWRLSRIEEELESAEVPDPGSTDDSDCETFPPPPDFVVQQLDTAIYSKPDHSRSLEEEAAKLAIKKITGKYDSLGRMQKGGGYIQAYAAYAENVDILTQSMQNHAKSMDDIHLDKTDDHVYTTRYLSQDYQSQNSYQPRNIYQKEYQPHGYQPQPQNIYQSHLQRNYQTQPQNSYQPQSQNTYLPQHNTFPQPKSFSQPQKSYQPQSLTYQPAKSYQPQVKNKMLSEQEVMQVEMFFRSHKTEVYVCQCATHMYFGTVRSSPTSKSPTQALPDDDSWTFFKNGVPVLVLDSGESRRSRKLSVVFAERSTGFILWKDTYNHLTDYKASHPSFHTLHLSNDHTKVVGLSFEDPGAASDFIRKIHSWTSDPNDSILKLHKKKKKKDDKKKKYKAPNKSDISSPCCFTHITQLDRSDGMTLLGSSSAPTSPARESMRTLHMSPIKMPKLTMVPPNT